MDYRNTNPMTYSARADAVTYDMGLRAYMLGIYNYMASALILTGLFAMLPMYVDGVRDALYVMQDGRIAGMTGLGWIVAFAPLVMALGLGFGVNAMSLGAAKALFWVYAGVMGLSLSSLAFIYTGESIARTFFITAIVFGGMSLWGYSTKRDLTAMGSFLMMGLFGIIIAALVNLFLQSSALQFAISVIGVIVFVGLTAYDTQKIKSMYYATAHDSVMAGKSAIMGALTLYLDFINLFVMLLRFFGERR